MITAKLKMRECLDKTKKRRKALKSFLRVCRLLDVILTDENQEEGTSPHLPALFDELQGILGTQRQIYTHTHAAFQFGMDTLFV